MNVPHPWKTQARDEKTSSAQTVGLTPFTQLPSLCSLCPYFSFQTVHEFHCHEVFYSFSLFPHSKSVGVSHGFAHLFKTVQIPHLHSLLLSTLSIRCSADQSQYAFRLSFRECPRNQSSFAPNVEKGLRWWFESRLYK